MSIFVHSGKGNPCLICSREKDSDCRMQRNGTLVFCHTERNENEAISQATGYKFHKESDKGAGWGVWYLPNPTKLNRPSVESQKTFYEYSDRINQQFIRVVRQKGANTPFYQEYYIQGEWMGSSQANKLGYSSKIKEMRSRVAIYRYFEVSKAIEEGKSIVWVEGEKTCDALWNAGIAAATSIGGSNGLSSWGDYKNDLDGLKTLLISPDMDQEGAKYAKAVENLYSSKIDTILQLKSYAEFPQWQHLPKAGGLDLADELEEGLTPSELSDRINEVITKSSKESKQIHSHDWLIEQVSELEKVHGIGSSKFDHGLLILSQKTKFPKTAIEGIYYKAIADTAQRTYSTIPELIAMQTEETREWIVSGLLPKGTTVLFYADGGVGKTLFIYDLLKLVHTSDTFLHKRVASRPKTLLIQTDEPQIDMVSRFQEKDMGGISDITVTTEWAFAEISRLKQKIINENFELVIIDSFTSASRYALTEEKDAMHSAILYQLRDIANSSKCSFIVIHHENKQGKVRGGTGMRNNVSEVWHLRKHNHEIDNFKMRSNERIFSVEKSRAGVNQRIIVAIEEDYSFVYINDLQKVQDGKENVPATWSEKILAVFQANPQLQASSHDLMEISVLNGLKTDTCKKNLSALHRRGEIMQIGTQNNTKGKPSGVFSLTGVDKHNPFIPLCTQTIDIPTLENGIDNGIDNGTVNSESRYGENTHNGIGDRDSRYESHYESRYQTHTGNDDQPITGKRDSHIAPRTRDENKNSDPIPDRFGKKPKDQNRSSSRAPLGSYTGPAIGQTIVFVPEHITEAELLSMRKRGQEYPWGAQGVITDVNQHQSGYSLNISCGERIFVITNLLAVEVVA